MIGIVRSTRSTDKKTWFGLGAADVVLLEDVGVVDQEEEDQGADRRADLKVFHVSDGRVDVTVVAGLTDLCEGSAPEDGLVRPLHAPAGDGHLDVGEEAAVDHPRGNLGILKLRFRRSKAS